MSHDSDWFGGTCECDEYPCKWSVAEQRRLEAAETMRMDMVQAYKDHHGEWPQASFIDAVLPSITEIALCEQNIIILRPNVLYRLSVHRDCEKCYEIAALYENERP